MDHSMYCPCPMDERNGECEGLVEVEMEGDNYPSNGIHATGHVTPCSVCGYGTADTERIRCMTIANFESGDYDSSDACDEDYDQ